MMFLRVFERRCFMKYENTFYPPHLTPPRYPIVRRAFAAFLDQAFVFLVILTFYRFVGQPGPVAKIGGYLSLRQYLWSGFFICRFWNLFYAPPWANGWSDSQSSLRIDPSRFCSKPSDAFFLMVLIFSILDLSIFCIRVRKICSVWGTSGREQW